MATVFSHPQICRGKSPAIFRSPPTSKPSCRVLLLTNPNINLVSSNSSWAVKSSSSTVEGLTPPNKEEEEEDSLEGLVDFLYEDLPHLFDDQGIDPTMYDDRVVFRDPITKHDTIAGYLFNIRLLKSLFQPQFHLHSVRQTGPYEITTRWTMVMKFLLLPWKPELIFTGLSIMGVNPQTQKFCSHTDLWDSIEKNDYFSFEGFLDVLKQLRIYKTPDLETPKYNILKRRATYEVRKYEAFVIAETKGDKLSGSSGFNDVAGYIFGKNSTNEKIPMTTPVFTQVLDDQSEVSIQIVLPVSKQLSNLPAPSSEAVRLRKVDGGIVAAIKFSGRPTDELVISKEKELRSALLKDGLRPKEGCLLARYNDPGRTQSFMMRNEVLIWLEEFTLE
uniref:SOUL heme-binding protein n=1 Tax=Crocus sativus TaxID=82528 RepID=A0A1S5T4X5_CROSA|nr:SOUL heme-binding protein [Crocus sativus]